MKFLMLLTFVPLALFLNKMCKKYNFLLSLTGEIHQQFISKKSVPLIGGFFIIFFCLLFLNIFLVKIFVALVFVFGIISDLKIIKSPLVKFIVQFFIIYAFVYLLDLNLENTRIIFLDRALENPIFNNFFLSFSILVIINGSNFIDGVNINNLGYYFTICLCLIFLSNDLNLVISKEFLVYFSLSIFILIILNSKSILFLGDSGSYLLGFLFSYFLIEMYTQNQNVSPFFIILLLWYPAFENLFSFIRKFSLDKSPLSPDNYHFHHAIRMYFANNKKLKKYNHNLPGIIINLTNGIFFYFGATQISNTQLQIFLITTLVVSYCFIYIRLSKLY